jgi:cell filamentation protein
VYDAVSDPYCYSGTTVLKNRANLRTQAELHHFEEDATAQRSTEPLPKGRLSVRHYCAIHHHLFRDVYRWAGRFRSVRISKGGSAFCYPEHIVREMRALFAALARQKKLRGLDAGTFAKRAAHFLAEVNAIHPFREGNGRTQLSFVTLLAHQAKHPLALDRIDPAAMLRATIKSFEGDERPLAAVIRGLIQ